MRSAVGSAALFVLGVGLCVTATQLGWPPGKEQAALVVIGCLAVALAFPATRAALRRSLELSRAKSGETRTLIAAQPRRLVAYACWFACVVGLGEISYLTYQKVVPPPGVMTFAFMWRLPIGYGVIFALILAVAYLGALRAPSKPVFFAFVACCAFVMAQAWMPLLIHGLYYLAAVVLAAGVGTLSARIIREHAYLFDRISRKSLPILAAAQLVLAAGFAYWPVWQENADIQRLNPVPEPKPNVVLIVLDTVRASSLGTYGYSRPTSPNLDRLASQGVVFDQAFSTAPWTLPSHGSMFTGRDPSELQGGFQTPITDRFPTLAEAMRQYGYLTSGFVANRLYLGAAYGLAKGFTHYKEERDSLTTSLMHTSVGSQFLSFTKLEDRWGSNTSFGRKSAAAVNAEVLGWLEARDKHRPFFVFMNYFDAHSNYLPPDEFGLRFSERRPNGRLSAKPLDGWGPDEVRELNDAYDGAIAYLDDQLGRLFEAMRASGALDNTIVVLTSDHGEQFGEHGLLEHSNSLYLPLLHVPLVVLYPPVIPAGKRIKSPVSLRSIPATILDLAGLPNPFGFRGSLAGDIRSSQSAEQNEGLLAEADQVTSKYPDSYPARKGRMQSLMFKGMHYIRNQGTGREELYMFLDDPAEVKDLSAARPDLVAEGRRLLDNLIRERTAAQGIAKAGK